MFPMKFGDVIIQVEKIQQEQFTPAHHAALDALRYEQERLLFPDERWHSVYLGAGEEKAVFCVCDHHQHIFAIELIDERHYLNGRFVGGTYFFDKRIPALNNLRARADSEFGLRFTGLVKVREFVRGYEWSRFQFDPYRKTLLDGFLTTVLQTLLSQQFSHYRSHYQDVHDRNVLFEIRPRGQAGIPLLVKTWDNRLTWVKVGLQPIDVR